MLTPHISTDEMKWLESLPKKMRTDIAINVHIQTLSKVQLFQDCDKALLRDLVLKLQPVLYLPGDFVCKKVGLFLCKREKLDKGKKKKKEKAH